MDASPGTNGDGKTQTTRSGTLNVRLPLDMLRAVDEARAEGETRTDVVLSLLTAGLQHRADQGEEERVVAELSSQLATTALERDAACKLAADRLDAIQLAMTVVLADSDEALTQALAAASGKPDSGQLLRALSTWKTRAAARPASSALPLDAALRERLQLLAQSMSGGGILGELGVTVSVDHVARLALNRGIAVLEGGSAGLPVVSDQPTGGPTLPTRPVPPAYAAQATSLPPRPQAPPGAYARVMPVSQAQIDNRPTKYAGWMASNQTPVAEAHGDFDSKMSDVPQNAMDVSRTPSGMLEPDPSWRPWAPDVDGEIAPEEAHLHNYYSMNGWYRWSKALPDGRVVTFYWSDDPRAQGIETFKGASPGLVIEPLPTGTRGLAHGVAAVQR